MLTPNNKQSSSIENTKWRKGISALNYRKGGLILLFSIVVYVILIYKIVTIQNAIDSLVFGIYSILITSYIFSRFILASFYKPIPIDPNFEPSVTFVVPAMNEEAYIYKTLKAFGDLNYPREKIEVIAINDGSTDRTYQEMRRVTSEIRKKVRDVTLINWKENRGKREGMAKGVKIARHDIIIFIDSDSFVEPNVVRHLVKHFKDPGVGAVSGYTGVENSKVNMLTQMQTVRYYISFKIYKAAEGIFGTITCCPGCCSAYRKSYLIDYIDVWRKQTFLGAKCTFGDDRSLTNYIIRNHKAVYSHEAKATTIVPETYKQFIRQQQRWKKSWIRETLIASTFMWRKSPIISIFFYVYLFLVLLAPIVFFRAILWMPAIYGIWPTTYFLGLLLMLLLHGLYYRIRLGPRPWLIETIGIWLLTTLLIWQLLWGAITIRDPRWGTR